YVNEDYVLSVSKNGGVPMILPVTDEERVLDGYINSIDALILSGGHDVCPFNYGEEPSPKLGDTFPARDQFDFALLRKAKEKNIPILGICRGAQIINVYHGGTLWQDLSYADQPFLKHWQEHYPDLPTHSIRIERGSLLYQIFGEEKMMVNSFHHQVMRHVPEEFRVVARAADTAIEAIEHVNYRFLVGVQWHPEMLYLSRKEMNRLFKALINEARGETVAEINDVKAVV
ncbi:gamma-glutamyl-gamma-aminobutyrate hydrolase family protein, partial [Streptococcus merionis]|uniref:gamma-glutamyl-gamma-aminobutyrate hydrolase family protein n=1 Tax=Streptococcus merionis TaxID=400065 RepID=UPI0026EBE7F1